MKLSLSVRNPILLASCHYGETSDHCYKEALQKYGNMEDGDGGKETP